VSGILQVCTSISSDLDAFASHWPQVRYATVKSTDPGFTAPSDIPSARIALKITKKAKINPEAAATTQLSYQVVRKKYCKAGKESGNILFSPR
jgi:hypothetical protein